MIFKHRFRNNHIDFHLKYELLDEGQTPTGKKLYGDGEIKLI